MILEVIASVLLGVLTGLLEFLPEAGESPFGSLGGFVPGYSALDVGLPVHEIMAGLGVLVAIWLGVFAWRLFLTVYRMIPAKFT